MGFGNSKRIDLVKDLLKEEKKKKLMKKERSMSRASSVSSMSSRQSARSLTTNDSSIGADDPFHVKCVMKVQRLWDKVKECANPVQVGEEFLKQALQNSYNDEQCKVLVETLDLLIHLLGPDIDEDDLEQASSKLEREGIPTAAVGDVFADCINLLLGGHLPQKDIDVMDNSIGMVLRDMLGA